MELRKLYDYADFDSVFVCVTVSKLVHLRNGCGMLTVRGTNADFGFYNT